MTQKMIVRLIPIEVLVLAALLGYSIARLHLVAPEMAPAERSREGTAAGRVRVSPVFTPEVLHWEKDIMAWSAAYGLDPNLVATVMQIESCGNPQAISRSGAQGLFQVMPYHFALGEEPLDPDTNAARGLDYLARGLTLAAGQAGLALAGYNGGHSQIERDSSLWPAETQRYYYWGAGMYAEASGGAGRSERLLEWLAAGGASLCARAAEHLGK